MKKAVLVLALVYFLFAPKSFSQTPADSSYWPLGLNYSWSYTIFGHYGDTSQIGEKISGTTVIENKMYFMIEDFTGRGGLTLYIRNFGDTLFYYTPEDSTEYVLFNFSASVGTSWHLDTTHNASYRCTIGNEVTLVGRSDTVSTPAGVFLNCIHMRHGGPCADAGWMDSWYAKGIGRVKLRVETYFGEATVELNQYTITSIRKPNVSDRRPSIALSQNYPNPASLAENRQTTIRYTIPAASDVQIVLYDALGRKLRTLFTGYQPGGTHEIAFNPASLVSGVYFYRVRSGQSTLVRKMILVK